MFPKQSGIPKKGFGSTLSFSNPIGFGFGSKEESRNSARGSHWTSNKNFSPTGRSNYRSPIQNRDLKINSLMRDIKEVREALNESKAAIIDELPAFQDMLYHEMQEMMFYFLDNLKSSQQNYARDFQDTLEALKSQAEEKEIVNQNLLEANRSLAQKNEALSKLLYNTTDKLNKVHSRESSLDDPRDRSMGYTTRYSQKLLHESKTIAKSLKRPQNLTPFNSARLKSQIGNPTSGGMSSARLKQKAKAFESQRIITTESECQERLFSVGNEEISRIEKKHILTAGEGSFVYVENEDAETNLLKSSVEQLVEDCQNYRRIALEENRKYVEALSALNIAAQEKTSFDDLKQKYAQSIVENEELIQKSHKALKQLTNLVSEKSHSGEKKETPPEEILKLQKMNEELAVNYAKSTKLLEEKLNLVVKEKALLENSLRNAREIGVIEKPTMIMTTTNSSSVSHNEVTLLKAQLEEARRVIENLKNAGGNNYTPEGELERLKKELEEANFKLSESARLYEENYTTHLDIINDLHSKLEVLSEEFEQLRKIEDKESGALKYSSKERDSTDSAGELFLKLDNLEKSLHWYLEERKKLMSENNDLRVELNTLKELKDEEDKSEDSEVVPPNKTEDNTNNNFELKIKELEDEILRLKEESNSQLEVVKIQKENVHAEMKQYKSQASTLEAKVLEIEASNNDLVEQNQQLEETLNTLTKEKQELFKKVKESHDIIEGLNGKITNLNQTIEQLNKEKESMKLSYEENYANSDSQKTEEKKLLNQKLEEIQSQYAELKNEKEMFEKLAQIDRERSEDLERQIERVKDDYESRINEYENLMNEFRNSHRDQKDSEDQILEKYQTLQGVCDNFEAQNEQLVREKEELEMELRMCQDENEELKKNMEEMTIKYNIGGGNNEDEEDVDVI